MIQLSEKPEVSETPEEILENTISKNCLILLRRSS